MHRMKALLALATVALAMLAPARAVAAPTYTDTLGGYEYWATSTEGRFAGTAAGDLPGTWNATVQHTPLCISCSPTATITGGSVSLATAVGVIPTLVTGTFTGGTVQVLNPGAGCTNQTFAVSGVLGDVGTWSSGSGTGTFAVTLTHFRRSLFGRCITYGASVHGTLSVTF